VTDCLTAAQVDDRGISHKGGFLGCNLERMQGPNAGPRAKLSAAAVGAVVVASADSGH
jgi:hypothetical protein